MKISICIPQYNRIAFLLVALERITQQTFRNIEIVISDDCSTDDTEEKIRNLMPSYPFPVIYSKSEKNIGYDANLRRSMEMASGDYCFILGNDDSLFQPDSMQKVVSFLEQNQYPEIGFCNMVEEENTEKVFGRAVENTVLGSGYEVALKYYSCFSFVGGLVFKRETFNRFNTNKHDGSVFVQIYLAVLMISTGCRLFSISDPIVLKDVIADETDHRNSYKDRLPRKWKDFYVFNGGLPSVINVLISGFRDAKVPDNQVLPRIFQRMYRFTVPNWILDYKSNKAFPAAVGITMGMFPYKVKHFGSMNILNQGVLLATYCVTSTTAMLLPHKLFTRYKNKLYRLAKKS